MKCEPCECLLYVYVTVTLNLLNWLHIYTYTYKCSNMNKYFIRNLGQTHLEAMFALLILVSTVRSKFVSNIEQVEKVREAEVMRIK